MKDATDSAYLLEASVSYLNRFGFHLCRGDAAILNLFRHSGFAENKFSELDKYITTNKLSGKSGPGFIEVIKYYNSPFKTFVNKIY